MMDGVTRGRERRERGRERRERGREMEERGGERGVGEWGSSVREGERCIR